MLTEPHFPRERGHIWQGLTDMPQEDEVSFYLERARELRVHAERTADPDLRAAELEIADRYEYLANKIIGDRSKRPAR